MTPRSLFSPAVLLAALVSAQAPAQTADNGITLGALEAYPTFECVGLRLAYTGDADSNAAVTVRYREKSSSTWLEMCHMSLSLRNFMPYGPISSARDRSSASRHRHIHHTTRGGRAKYSRLYMCLYQIYEYIEYESIYYQCHISGNMCTKWTISNVLIERS